MIKINLYIDIKFLLNNLFKIMLTKPVYQNFTYLPSKSVKREEDVLAPLRCHQKKGNVSPLMVAYYRLV
jgi:hypothetical protein